MRSIIYSVAALLIGTGAAHAQFPTSDVPTSDAEYVKKAKTAAPETITGKATIIVLPDQGQPKTLQTGSNGFTCMVDATGTPLCADPNAMEWLKAVGAKATPPDKTGFIYMMAGDTGTTNHDPHQRQTHVHWVQTGPHVMVVGAAARDMAGNYPKSLDPDPSQPYVMFPGTPYEHLMLPAR